MKEKDPYYEKLNKEFVQKYKNKSNWWIDDGWINFILFIVFLSMSIIRLNRGLENAMIYLYISIGLFIISIIQLIIGYTKKKSS